MTACLECGGSECICTYKRTIQRLRTELADAQACLRPAWDMIRRLVSECCPENWAEEHDLSAWGDAIQLLDEIESEGKEATK